jgi:hypothetical protein
MIAAAVVTLAALAAGCTRHGADSKPAARVTVTAEWPGGEAELPEGGAHKPPGGLEVSRFNGQLKVNGMSYGPVQAGDRVKIDKSGAVTVNGQGRQPSPPP